MKVSGGDAETGALRAQERIGLLVYSLSIPDNPIGLVSKPDVGEITVAKALEIRLLALHATWFPLVALRARRSWLIWLAFA